MGDPKKTKTKFSMPAHPWQKERIDEEKVLLREYGLKNKSEIYKAQSSIKSFADMAKKLIAARGPQAEKERQQLLIRLAKLGLIKSGAQLDDILGLHVKNLLDRRLQTLAFKKGLARSMSQSRQFITHQHITVNKKIVSAPGYYVLLGEETTLAFISNSPLASTAHSERALPPKKVEKRPEPKEERNRRGPRKVVRPKK